MELNTIKEQLAQLGYGHLAPHIEEVNQGVVVIAKSTEPITARLMLPNVLRRCPGVTRVEWCPEDANKSYRMASSS